MKNQTIQSPNKRFNKDFNEWLWGKKKYNPFLKYMAKIGRNLPEVKQVDKK